MRQYTCIEQEKRWLIQLPELTGCVEKIEPQVTIDLMPYSPYLDRNEKINFLGESFNLSDHSCPQRPCSFWSAPRVAASSWVWFSEHVQRIRFVLSAYQTCQIWLWVCTEWTSGSLWIMDVWRWTFPEVVLGADQKERGLWRQECLSDVTKGLFP